MSEVRPESHDLGVIIRRALRAGCNAETMDQIIDANLDCFYREIGRLREDNSMEFQRGYEAKTAAILDQKK